MLPACLWTNPEQDRRPGRLRKKLRCRLSGWNADANLRGRVRERCEKALLRPFPKEELRVPLHPDEEGGRRTLDSLHDPAVVLSDNHQIPAEPVDGLVMERIHPAWVAAQDPVESAARDN